MVAPMAIALRARAFRVRCFTSAWLWIGRGVRSDGHVHSGRDLRGGPEIAIPSRLLGRGVSSSSATCRERQMKRKRTCGWWNGAAGCRRCLARERHRTAFHGRARFRAGRGSRIWPACSSRPAVNGTNISAFSWCVQDAIDRHPEAVQTLADGIDSRDLWLDEKEARQTPSPSRRRFLGRFYSTRTRSAPRALTNRSTA